MSDSTLQSDNGNNVSSRISVNSSARLTFFSDKGQNTCLGNLYQTDPQRILFPNTSIGDITQAALVTTSGGLVGGDRISIDIEMGKNTRAIVLPQAAEKIYRSSGLDTKIGITFSLEDRSWLEYLPQETILFQGSRLSRQTKINLSKGARAFVGEILVFGRFGYGEKFNDGLIQDSWEIYKDGNNIWADSFYMEDHIQDIMSSSAGLNNAQAIATAVYVGPDAEENLGIARKILSSSNEDVLMGATYVNETLVIRWISNNTLNLRNEFGRFWSSFRNQVEDLPATLPRLWNM